MSATYLDGYRPDSWLSVAPASAGEVSGFTGTVAQGYPWDGRAWGRQVPFRPYWTGGGAAYRGPWYPQQRVFQDVFAQDDAGVAFPAGQLWALVAFADVSRLSATATYRAILMPVPSTLPAGYQQITARAPGLGVQRILPFNTEQGFSFGYQNSSVTPSNRNNFNPASLLFRRSAAAGGGIHDLTGESHRWWPQAWNTRVAWWSVGTSAFSNDGAGLATATIGNHETVGWRAISWDVSLTHFLQEGFGFDGRVLGDTITAARVIINDGTSDIHSQTISFTLQSDDTYVDYYPGIDVRERIYRSQGSATPSALLLSPAGGMKTFTARVEFDGPGFNDMGDPLADDTTFDGGAVDGYAVRINSVTARAIGSIRADVPLPWPSTGLALCAPGGVESTVWAGL